MTVLVSESCPPNGPVSLGMAPGARSSHGHAQGNTQAHESDQEFSMSDSLAPVWAVHGKRSESLSRLFSLVSWEPGKILDR